MTGVDPRAELERLVRERRDDYANLSRLIGKNPAYIQQFIKRGSPKRLGEGDRRRLASYFGVSEELLGGPDGPSSPPEARRSFIPIPRYDVRASAGPGALVNDGNAVSHIGFDQAWLRQLSGGRAQDLSLIRVEGDSMWPTLSDGEDILVNRADGSERLRDGIYVLRRDDALLVKRVALNPAARRVEIKSDNDAYPTWPDCKISDIAFVGRVVWAGRRIS